MFTTRQTNPTYRISLNSFCKRWSCCLKAVVSTIFFYLLIYQSKSTSITVSHECASKANLTPFLSSPTGGNWKKSPKNDCEYQRIYRKEWLEFLQKEDCYSEHVWLCIQAYRKSDHLSSISHRWSRLHKSSSDLSLLWYFGLVSACRCMQD